MDFFIHTRLRKPKLGKKKKNFDRSKLGKIRRARLPKEKMPRKLELYVKFWTASLVDAVKSCAES